MAAEEQEIDWIEFELDGRKLRIDREDSNNLQVWRDTYRGQVMKKPYWRQMSVTQLSNGYFRCSISHTGLFQHHRIVYYAHNPDWDIHDTSMNNFIDHIDQNRSNNHISNLRVVNHSQNQQNQNAKGYSYHKASKKWQARIILNGKYKHLGCYGTEEEARDIYIKAKREHHPFFHES